MVMAALPSVRNLRAMGTKAIAIAAGATIAATVLQALLVTLVGVGVLAYLASPEAFRSAARLAARAFHRMLAPAGARRPRARPRRGNVDAVMPDDGDDGVDGPGGGPLELGGHDDWMNEFPWLFDDDVVDAITPTMLATQAVPANPQLSLVVGRGRDDKEMMPLPTNRGRARVPVTCEHPRLSSRGSNGYARRLTCVDCHLVVSH